MEESSLKLLSCPNETCSVCGSRLLEHHKVLASVLAPDGWTQVEHAGKRCRRSSCDRYHKLVWHNYVSMSRQDHQFEWDSLDSMDYFFVEAHWGVSCAWLRQMSRRVAQLGCIEGSKF